jgi:hypothetical protein
MYSDKRIYISGENEKIHTPTPSTSELLWMTQTVEFKLELVRSRCCEKRHPELY